MVNIAKLGDSAIKFTFTDNYRYLHNGEIEVPLNSLILVVDESDMVTFKKIDGDPFVSFLISDSNFESKETLIYFYKTSMVGGTGGGSESGITSGDVESMISASLEDYYDIDEVDTALSGKQDTLVAGSGITISGNVISAEGGSITIDPSLDSGSTNAVANSAITNALDSKIQNFWTNSTSQSTIRLAITKNGWSYSDKDLLNLYNGLKTRGASGLTIDLNENQEFKTYSAATDARISEDEEVTAAAFNALNDELSAKQDTLVAGSGITISGNVISAEGGNNVIELTQAQYDALVSGGTVDPNAFYIITDATEINISDYYTSAQTQSAINAAVSGKQDTLIAGSGITISGNVISAIGGGGGIDSGTVQTMIDGSISGKADTSAVTEISSAVSGKMDTSAFTSYSAATDARLSEDEEVTAAALNALNDKFDGLRLKKLTQAEYEALVTKDSQTLYIITDS